MKLAKITGKLIGMPFDQCGCIDLVHRFYRELGLDLPTSVNGWGLHNYRELWNRDKKMAQAIMLKSFKLLGQPVALNRVRIADLLVIMQKSRVMFPAVYTGQGTAITSFTKTGVSIFRVNAENRIIMARRLF